MSFTPSISPITENNKQLQELLLDPGVELPPLLPALAFALNDLSVLPIDLSLDPSKTLEEQGGLTVEEQEKVRLLAFAALQRLRDEPLGNNNVSDDDLQKIMSWACGTDLNGSYLQMLKEELSPNDNDLRSPDWVQTEVDEERDFTVAVIGAGMSGILAAYRLKQAGVNFILFEKNSGIGGTWLENTYPGCRVDVSNHVYCYSFMQKHDWPHFHSTQNVLLQYFNDCADIFGIRDNIRFGTNVSSAVWDENEGNWNLEISSENGEEIFACQSVISAVGQLNRPSYPDIPGVDTYRRESWHSAHWNHDYDLSGKNVAVIGTGCSAVQFIPRVAEVAANTTIFQRTPNWLMPRPQYQQRLPESLLWCFDHIPHYHNWFRLHLFWRSHEGLLPRLELDPDWENPGDNSISSENHELGLMLRLYLQSEFSEHPELLEKVTPNFTLGAKRFVIDDGLWAETLRRDNVELCTEEITSITETGIETVGGEHNEFDAIIYGTGFKASEFLTPMKVVGRGGIDLHEQWDGDARAYLGIVAPNFPNFFFLYGPNTNIVINGSIIYFSECEVHFVTRYINYLLANNVTAMDVKQEIHDAYNDRVDAGNRQMAWGISDVNSWYKNASGRTAQNWPFSLLEYWEQTREVNPSDFEML
ncbi:MAG: NAD(P)/FAD-dependent oxidoreductase [Acidimicrobiales bacterium]|jgi:4-hydroxyacetophenone monooxygenase|nr:NAD(P)/FAD-dependent oxidoreductase [Acidimicrobiales bacterium]MDP6299107.1 NAD(P)/FAD-dependent oxidoreductase [Acidimicrobiales bacterium]HJM27997.1 NAD(P)/FAD-dependent oxidoreductase [Acidimicrobiales bacterium]HJM97374.1 NAD(P)/FAD-dependent oxidoreductase [Acidimicrobiales bacterium]